MIPFYSYVLTISQLRDVLYRTWIFMLMCEPYIKYGLFQTIAAAKQWQRFGTLEKWCIEIAGKTWGSPNPSSASDHHFNPQPLPQPLSQLRIGPTLSDRSYASAVDFINPLLRVYAAGLSTCQERFFFLSFRSCTILLPATSSMLYAWFRDSYLLGWRSIL